MSARSIHFNTVSPHPRILVRPLCERANTICSEANSSPFRHEVTCKHCLRRLMATATFAMDLKAIKSGAEMSKP